MKRTPVLGIALLVFLTGIVVVLATKNKSGALNRQNVSNSKTANVVSTQPANTNNLAPNTASPDPANINAVPTPEVNTNTVTPAITPTPTPSVVVPMADFFNRVTKKPFGIYITPKTSPVQPEKFTGYHTGADAETTVAEKDVDIPIFAIAAGRVVLTRHVTGYGGVVMITSVIDGQTITVLYGHLRQTSFKFKLGQTVQAGQQIAALGTGNSTETDGERKHLHLGILNGESTNVKGYVATKSQLSAWLDPVAWLKSRAV